MSSVVSYLPGAAATPTATTAEIQRVFERQRETAIRLRTSTAQERIAKIKRLCEAMMTYRQQIHEAAYLDFKKPPAEVDLAEVLPVVSEAKHAMRALKKWMKPKGVWPTSLTIGLKSWVQYEPKGRCLIVSPWNYNVNLCFGPLVSCIAAGNTAILKPSEMTPHLSALMAKMVRELFPEDEVALFEGDVTVSTALLELPFDHIFFTGSPAVGKVVMAAAAKHLTSVTLELGGKSPTIIDDTADLAMAARTLMWGKYTNNGQTCIAPDYIYVHASKKDAFAQECIKVIEECYGKTAAEQMNSPYLARVVNQRHTKRINTLLTDAKQRGARVLCGGEAVENPVRGDLRAAAADHAVHRSRRGDRRDQRRAQAAGALHLEQERGDDREGAQAHQRRRHLHQPLRGAIRPRQPAVRRRQQLRHRQRPRPVRLQGVLARTRGRAHALHDGAHAVPAVHQLQEQTARHHDQDAVTQP
jgi:aldehyde dehydrogenase (NAD+)